MKFVFALCGALIIALGAARAESDGETQRAVAALKSGGHYGLMRHARAPGREEPPGARLGQCATQRNLDDEGRKQAQAIGAGLRRANVIVFKLYASRWCRAFETAELLAVGDVEPLDILNAFPKPEDERDQTRHLRALVAQPITTPSVLLVTHHDNIAALTRIVAREGEIVVIRPQGRNDFAVVGRIPPDALRD